MILFFSNKDSKLYYFNDVSKIINCSICEVCEEVKEYVLLNNNSKHSYIHKKCASDFIYNENEKFKNKDPYGFIVLGDSKITNDSLFDQKQEVVDEKPFANIDFVEPNLITIKHQFDEDLLSKYRLYGLTFYKALDKSWVFNLNKCTLDLLLFVKNLEDSFPKYNWGITEVAFLKMTQKFKELKEKNQKNSIIKKSKEQLVDTKHPQSFENLIESMLPNVLISTKNKWELYSSIIQVVKKKNFKALLVTDSISKFLWLKIIRENGLRDNLTNNSDIDIYICSIDEIVKKANDFKKFKLNSSIIDNSELLENKKNKKNLKKIIEKSPNKIFINSKIKIDKDPFLFYEQLLFMNKELFQNKKQYIYRYCDAKITEKGIDKNGCSNIQELKRKISYFFVELPVGLNLTNNYAQKFNYEIKLNKKDKDELATLKNNWGGYDNINISPLNKFYVEKKIQHLIKNLNDINFNCLKVVIFIPTFYKEQFENIGITHAIQDLNQFNDIENMNHFFCFTDSMEKLKTIQTDIVFNISQHTINIEKNRYIVDFSLI